MSQKKEKKLVKEDIINALSEIYDPEIPINIVDLGLIYNINIDEENNIDIDMTMTAKGCPMHAFITKQVKDSVEKLDGAGKVKVNMVWDPPWTPDRISKKIRESF